VATQQYGNIASSYAEITIRLTSWKDSYFFNFKIKFMTLKEFRIWFTIVLIDLAFHVCPDGKFKQMFAFFLNTNIKKLNDGN